MEQFDKIQQLLQQLREAVAANETDRQKAIRNQLVTELHDRILNRIRFLLRQFPHITEHSGDILSNVYLKLDELLKRPDMIDTLRTDLDILRVVTQRVRWALLDIARASGRTVALPEESWKAPPESGASVPSLAAELERRERVMAAMDSLTDQQRLLIEWIDQEQQSNVEVARRLGVDERTIRRWHNDATYELRRLVNSQ